MSYDTSFHLFDAKLYDQAVKPEVLACVSARNPAGLETRIKTFPSHIQAGWREDRMSPIALGEYVHHACSKTGKGEHLLFEGGIHQDLEELDEDSFGTAEDLFEVKLGSARSNLEPCMNSKDWGLQGFLRNEQLKALLPKLEAIELEDEDGPLAQLFSLFRKAVKEGWGLSCWAG